MLNCKNILRLLLVGMVFYTSSCSYNKSTENTDLERIIVLTFDDAVKSHLTHVAPLLQKYEFGATFFVSYRWMNDSIHFLSWEEIAKLYKMGFEIGNHSWTHQDFSQPRQASELAGELGLIEWMLMQQGIPKPVSFAYTGNGFGPEAIEVLKQEGYQYARRGMQPEVEYGSKEPGPTYNPKKNNPLLIPTTRDGYPGLSVDDYIKVIEMADEDKIVVLQFHGIPDITHPWVDTSFDVFNKVMKYLKENKFKVVALRDLGPLIPDKLPEDTLLQYRYTLKSTPGLIWPLEVEETREHIDFWMENMVNYHHFSNNEIQKVTGYNFNEIETQKKNLKKTLEIKNFKDHVIIKPYPGGRHPRIGFKDGMRSPMRGTKASAFLPWNTDDYIIIDLPEAVFTQYGLTFLGHKHIPTVFDFQNIQIHNRDWKLLGDGGLENKWILPNQMIIHAEIHPGSKSIDLKLSLYNGSQDTVFTNLKTQVCVMFKNAPEFNAQTNENKIFNCPVTAVHSADSSRWIITAWEHCHTAWGNEDCPCMHADPVFPDCKPGELVQLSGKIWFYDGDNVQAELEKIRNDFLYINQ